MPKAMHLVGQSNQKGFTPMGEKLDPSDVSGLIPCILNGPAITRPTVLYIHRNRLGHKVNKYALLGLTLIVPARVRYKKEPLPVAGEPVVPVHVPRNITASSRPVICLNTGRFFDSTRDLARAYGLLPQLVSTHLRGNIKSAKGRRMRYATKEEIADYDAEVLQV